MTFEKKICATHVSFEKENFVTVRFFEEKKFFRSVTCDGENVEKKFA